MPGYHAFRKLAAAWALHASRKQAAGVDPSPVGSTNANVEKSRQLLNSLTRNAPTPPAAGNHLQSPPATTVGRGMALNKPVNPIGQHGALVSNNRPGAVPSITGNAGFGVPNKVAMQVMHGAKLATEIARHSLRKQARRSWLLASRTPSPRVGITSSLRDCRAVGDWLLAKLGAYNPAVAARTRQQRKARSARNTARINAKRDVQLRSEEVDVPTDPIERSLFLEQRNRDRQARDAASRRAAGGAQGAPLTPGTPEYSTGAQARHSQMTPEQRASMRRAASMASTAERAAVASGQRLPSQTGPTQQDRYNEAQGNLEAAKVNATPEEQARGQAAPYVQKAQQAAAGYARGAVSPEQRTAWSRSPAQPAVPQQGQPQVAQTPAPTLTPQLQEAQGAAQPTTQQPLNLSPIFNGLTGLRGRISSIMGGGQAGQAGQVVPAQAQAPTQPANRPSAQLQSQAPPQAQSVQQQSLPLQRLHGLPRPTPERRIERYFTPEDAIGRGLGRYIQPSGLPMRMTRPQPQTASPPIRPFGT